MVFLHQPQTAGLSDVESADAERLWSELDEQNRRPEVVHGRVVVKPVPGEKHNDVIDELMEQLFDVKRANGWRFFTNWDVHIPPIRGDRRCPDLIIGPRKPPKYDDNQVYGHGVLLVVEVVSDSSMDDDYVAKRSEYARAGIPMYLIADPIQVPNRVALLRDPRPVDLEKLTYDYRTVVQVAAGEPLELPEPFGTTLDSEALFR